MVLTLSMLLLIPRTPCTLLLKLNAMANHSEWNIFIFNIILPRTIYFIFFSQNKEHCNSISLITKRSHKFPAKLKPRIFAWISKFHGLKQKNFLKSWTFFIFYPHTRSINCIKSFDWEHIQQWQRTCNFSSGQMPQWQHVIPQIHRTWTLDMNECDSGTEREDLCQLLHPSHVPGTYQLFFDWNFPLLAPIHLLYYYTMWSPKKLP